MRTSRPELYCRLAMSARTKAKSRIHESVRETARDLHAAGLIDMRRIREYDVSGLYACPRVFQRDDPGAATPIQTQSAPCWHWF